MNHATSGATRSILEPGTLIAGKYRIERVLAEGGMGLVVAAKHLHLDQSVALKFLRADASAEWDALARFTREAKAAAQLRSEHVAHVLDAGLADDGTPYMVMEYLEGHSLARTLQTDGPLSVSAAAEYVVQACEGLAEAHARGIVHRDVKPYNLFLVDRAPGWQIVKILDFGISKFAFSDPQNIVTGVIIGSPCYMSPEQLRSTASVDHRTDIWSLGATLYELLAGRAAFDASQTLPELVAAILDDSVRPLHEVRPEVPPELSAVVARCLSKNRDARFSSAGEMATALLPFAPPRARVVAERAASMKPAFRIAGTDPEIASGMPVPAWNHAETKRSAITLDSEESGPSPMSDGSGIRDVRETTSDAPAAIDLPSSEPKPSDETAGSPRGRAFRWIGIGTLASAAVVVFVTTRVAATQTRAQASTAVSAAAQVTAPAVARPEAPAPVETLAPIHPASPELLELRVRTSPATARITIDGTAAAENPLHAFYPRDGQTHRITVKADGYESKSSDIVLSKDTVVDISLNQRPVRPAWSSPSSAAARSAKRAAAAAAAPIATSSTVTPMASSGTGIEVDSTGGRAPLRPIETKDPYGR